MHLDEMLDHAITKEENGTYNINDIELHSDKCGVDVYIGWHNAAFNVGFYPIIQVDDDEGNMILWKSGSENPADWHRWMEEILEDYLLVDDWWFIR